MKLDKNFIVSVRQFQYIIPIINEVIVKRRSIVETFNTLIFYERTLFILFMNKCSGVIVSTIKDIFSRV